MRSAVAAVATCALALGLAAGGSRVVASSPRPALVVEDYPLAPGMEWTYVASAGVKVVRRAEREVVIDGRTYVEMAFVLPVLGTHRFPMRRARDGVVAWHDGREHLLIRFPLRTGDKWLIDLPGFFGATVNDVAECEVLGEEEIAFLGRRGMATKLRVTRTNRRTGKRAVDHEWYVPGVGLARMEVTFFVRAVFVLERFESGQ